MSPARGYYCAECRTEWVYPSKKGTCPRCHDVYIGGWYYRIRSFFLLKVIGFAALCYLFYRLFS
jgi:hypothetical protein